MVAAKVEVIVAAIKINTIMADTRNLSFLVFKYFLLPNKKESFVSSLRT
jgi:hypothetical protein